MDDRKRRCSYCWAMHLCRKPTRRRPTDSEILTWLVRHGYESGLCDPFTRSDVVKLMRAKRDGK